MIIELTNSNYILSRKKGSVLFIDFNPTFEISFEKILCQFTACLLNSKMRTNY